MASLGFLKPEVLIWTVGLVPMLLALNRFDLLRRNRSKLLGFAGSESHIGRCIFPSLLALPFIIALARPYTGYEDIKIRTEGRDIFAILDISRSMLADDVSPSRLEMAKRKLKDLVSLVQSNSPGDRVAIVLFSGEAYLYCPPTSDLGVLSQFIDAISSDLISSQGSELGAAIDRALKSISDIGSVNPLLVLFSDGEDNALNLEIVIDKLKKASLPISVLGFGTADGHPIPIANGTFLKDSRGNIVVSKLNQQSLIALARRSSGIYFNAGYDDSDLKQILLSHKTSNKGTQVEKEIRIYHEIGSLILWFPAILLLGFLVSKKSYALPVVLAGLLFSTSAYSESDVAKELPKSGSLREAYEAYQSGDFKKSTALFESALKDSPNNRKAQQALGNSYYREGRYQESQRIFNSLAQSARTERDAFESNYNLGNSELLDNKAKEAIAAYEQALKYKPNDKATAFNLELAKKLLEKQQQQKEKEQKNQEKKDQQDKEQQDQKQSSNDKDKSSESNRDNKDQDGQSDSKPKDKQDKDSKEEQDKDKPSAKESPSPTNSEKSKGNQNKAQDSEQDQPTEQGTPAELQNGAEKLKDSEAEAWLQSLPDAPLLLQQRRGRTPYNREQTW